MTAAYNIWLIFPKDNIFVFWSHHCGIRSGCLVSRQHDSPHCNVVTVSDIWRAGFSCPTPLWKLSSWKTKISWWLLRGKCEKKTYLYRIVDANITRLRMNQQGIKSNTWKWNHVKESVMDLKTWLWFAMMFSISWVLVILKTRRWLTHVKAAFLAAVCPHSDPWLSNPSGSTSLQQYSLTYLLVQSNWSRQWEEHGSLWFWKWRGLF